VPEGPVVSHMEGQGRPRRIPDAEMGPQKPKWRAKGAKRSPKAHQREPQGEQKRAQEAAGRTQRVVQQSMENTKQNKGFVKFGQPVPSQKGSERCPVRDPAARGEPRGPKAAPQDPSWTPKGTPREPKGNQKSYETFAASTNRSRQPSSGGSPPL